MLFSEGENHVVRNRSEAEIHEGLCGMPVCMSNPSAPTTNNPDDSVRVFLCLFLRDENPTVRNRSEAEIHEGLCIRTCIFHYH